MSAHPDLRQGPTWQPLRPDLTSTHPRLVPCTTFPLEAELSWPETLPGHHSPKTRSLTRLVARPLAQPSQRGEAALGALSSRWPGVFPTTSPTVPTSSKPTELVMPPYCAHSRNIGRRQYRRTHQRCALSQPTPSDISRLCRDSERSCTALDIQPQDDPPNCTPPPLSLG